MKLTPVVAEMHARVPEILPGGVVADRGEPDEALLVEVDAKWIVGGDSHVEPEVPFMTVDKERVINVFGNNLKIQGL